MRDTFLDLFSICVSLSGFKWISIKFKISNVADMYLVSQVFPYFKPKMSLPEIRQAQPIIYVTRNNVTFSYSMSRLHEQ